MDSSLNTPQAGQVLDHKYRIVKLLGRGGMGDVYEAEHLRLQRPVAVKLLRAQLLDGSQGSEPLRRFEREAKTACRIDHPNAVSIFDYGVVDSQPYLVMNLVQGESLKQFLAAGNRLEVEEVLDLLEQISSALEQAHSMGIVHRDLKPDNIMLDIQADGRRRAQVLDFGLAKLVSDSLSGSSLTNSGDTLGTPLYMSPEQVQGIETDTTSDIYSFGIIAYELLAGDVPFRAEQAMSVLYKHLHETPPALREINPEFPDLPKVEEVFQKVLAKTPQERFPNVSQFVGSLRAALDGVEYVPQREQKISRQRKFVAPFVLLALLSLLMLAFVVGRRSTINKPILAKNSSQPLVNQRETKELNDLEKRVGGLEKSNKSIEERLKIAEQLLSEQKVHAAHNLLRPIVIEDPNRAHAHFLLAKTHLRLRRPVAAYEHFQHAARLDPNNELYAAALKKAQNIKSRIEPIQKKPWNNQRRFREKNEGRSKNLPELFHQEQQRRRVLRNRPVPARVDPKQSE